MSESESDDDLLALRRALGGGGPAQQTPALTGPDDSAEPEISSRARPLAAAAFELADFIVGSVPVEAGGRPILRLPNGDSLFVDSAATVGRWALEQSEHRDGRVSRQHAEIRGDGRQLTVSDLGSSNGTFRVREGEVTPVGSEPVELLVGDMITTIDDVLLATVVEGEAES